MDWKSRNIISKSKVNMLDLPSGIHLLVFQYFIMFLFQAVNYSYSLYHTIRTGATNPFGGGKG